MAVLAVIAGLAWWAWSSAQTSREVPAEQYPSRVHPQGDLYVGAYAEPQDLNPFTTREQVSMRAVLRYTHDALLEFDPESGALRPALAESYHSSADGLVHTFMLRRARFADGAEVTTDDVMFTYRAGRNPRLARGVIGAAVHRIADLRTRGEREIVITMDAATAHGLADVATALRVVRRAYFEAAVARLAAQRGRRPPADPESPEFGEMLSELRLPGPGTGPYSLEVDSTGRVPTWRRGVDLTLLANPHSWRREVFPERWNLGGLRLVFLPNRAARAVALRRQEIDWMVAPDPEAVLSADRELATHYVALDYTYPGLGVYAVLWNHRRPALGDVRVRRALTMLFDRDAIAAELLHGHATVANSWFPPWHADRPAASAGLPFDPEAARRLLASAGYSGERPLRLELEFPASQQILRRVVEFSQPAFARAGVVVRARAVDYAELVADLRAAEFDGAVVLLTQDRWADPHRSLHTSQIGGGSNWMGYSDPITDGLIEQARRASEPRLRHQFYSELDARLDQQQPFTLLVHPRAAILFHRRFRDAAPGALGMVPEKWWVPRDEQIHGK